MKLAVGRSVGTLRTRSLNQVCSESAKLTGKGGQGRTKRPSVPMVAGTHTAAVAVELDTDEEPAEPVKTLVHVAANPVTSVDPRADAETEAEPEDAEPDPDAGWAVGVTIVLTRVELKVPAGHMRHRAAKRKTQSRLTGFARIDGGGRRHGGARGDEAARAQDVRVYARRERRRERWNKA
ncbi:MAG: hypothetical protein INR71_15150 [Terriglobus roseus]|nr:hypothetical protein [Terriglobus roseus]